MRKISVALLGLALAACNPMAQADSADEAAEKFHQDFSAGNFDKIWDETADEFKASTPRNEFQNMLANLQTYYGAYQGGSREGISLNSNNGVTTTEINMDTTYANSRAHETFLFVGTGDDMRLLNWSIEPDDGSSEGEAEEGEPAPADAGKPTS